MYNQNDPADMMRYIADQMAASSVGSSDLRIGAFVNKTNAKIAELEQRIEKLEKMSEPEYTLPCTFCSNLNQRDYLVPIEEWIAGGWVKDGKQVQHLAECPTR